jgi:hypothetical protein
MIDFKFREVKEKDAEDDKDVSSRFPDDFVKFCFDENKDDRRHPPAESCKERF